MILQPLIYVGDALQKKILIKLFILFLAPPLIEYFVYTQVCIDVSTTLIR